MCRRGQFEYYAWECVEALRKFLLIGFARLPFLGPGSPKQLFYGLIISLCHLFFLSLCKPFAHISEDYLAAGTSFALVCVFATCILFQMDELYVAVEETLTEEFRERFNPSTLALTLALLGCLVSGLVALAFLMTAEARAERRRHMFLSDDDLKLLLDTVNKTVAESMASGKEEASIGRVRRIKTAAKLKVGVVDVNEIACFNSLITVTLILIVLTKYSS